MPSFGPRSLACLNTCHADLQRVALVAIQHMDFAVICGERGRAEQEAAYAKGASHAHFGQSPHNFAPSLAFDAAPRPLDWNDAAGFSHLADTIKAAAVECGVIIEWGGDFPLLADRDHFQLASWKTLARVK